tara:strand:- start:288 stop:914 length:627 start_codon:yes stop_codon:yes gene_type:complete
MIDLENNKSFVDKLSDFFSNNLKYIILFFISLILLIIFFQYYSYHNENKNNELSLMFDQQRNNYNSQNFDETMNNLAKENGIFSILANIEIIKKSLKNKNYDFAYNKYIEILNSSSKDSIYNSLISLHGAYNLIDYVNNDKIIVLISYIDESYINLLGYKKEINYLLAVKNNDKYQRDLLFSEITDNENISPKIKDRVRKINEFEKYK